MGYGLDDLGVGVRCLAGSGDISLLSNVHSGSGAHPASYAMSTGGCFLRENDRGVKLTTHLHQMQGLGMLEVYLHSTRFDGA
jgi:hypothetical protein